MQLTVLPLLAERMENEFDVFEALENTLEKNQTELQEGDIIVISTKYISNSQGRVVDLEKIKASEYGMKIAEEFVTGAASMHGRILVLNEACAKESTGHGSPMPLLTHGGPGRAGGGEEMGGVRGILHYLQRTAIQGHPSTITSLTKQYQVGAEQNTEGPHIFRKWVLAHIGALRKKSLRFRFGYPNVFWS